MKILLGLILLFLFNSLSTYAVEEVILDTNDYEIVQQETEETDFFERIKNIKSKEITDTTKISYLLGDVLNKEFETGIVKNVHYFTYYRGGVDLNISDGDNDLEYDFNSISTCFNGKFRDEKSGYEAWFRVNPQHDVSFFRYLPSNLYVYNNSIPNHTIMLGNFRTPTGYEGGRSMITIPFVTRAQISRNFGNLRKVGLRVKGDYDLVEYDIGGYDSSRYFASFFPGAEFAGWINLKPLGKTDGKYGNLKMGGGLSAGHNNTDYCVTGIAAEYEYKNFMANFEYAAANGYNGARTISTKHAEGFYSTIGYKITPRLQILGRYDHYVPDKNFANDIRREYTAGINYFIKGQALKVMLNYVFGQNDLHKDSHRIILGTQIIL